MNPALLAIPLLLAQGPLCGGIYNLRPEDAPFTGCFVPNWNGDGGGAQIRIDPLFSPSGYRAKPVPPRELPRYIPPAGVQGP